MPTRQTLRETLADFQWDSVRSQISSPRAFSRVMTTSQCSVHNSIKNFTDARDVLANDTAALHAIRIKVLDALSLPSGEPGSAPLPEEQH
jgi:hypothetical protein